MSDQTVASDTSGLGANAKAVAQLYRRYVESPDSVDAAWQGLFADLDQDAQGFMAGLAGLGVDGGGNGATDGSVAAVAHGVAGDRALSAEDIRSATLDSIRALMLIRAYRVRGHLEAYLDPLGLAPKVTHPELDPLTYGFGEADMNRPIFINGVLGYDTATLTEIMQAVRATYCSQVGVEFMHIQDPAQKAWIQERVENSGNRTKFSADEKLALLRQLTDAESFERFLDKKYTGTKRFGLDGAEATVPALEEILRRGSELGLEEVVIGMPHRGRLNVLAHVMGKPFAAIFSEFQGGAAHPEDIGGSGDVKYHLGTSSDRDFAGNEVHLSLTANPSHLEAVDPVVVGKVRAKQVQRGDNDRTQVMALLLHGDAAFAGQGLVAETLDLSELKGYRIGGTIHFIVNNQIGFTTNPVNSRSGPYCSEVAKMVQAPIFHVNGDDPEAVVHVARIAIEFRQTFKKDVVVDMFCYRRFGHNEGDEPMFTQPRMYKKIAKHPSARRIYADKLVQDGVIGKDAGDQLVAKKFELLEDEFEAATSFKPNKADWLEGAWAGMENVKGWGARRGETGVPREILLEVGGAITQVPDGFNVNRKITRQLDAKRKALESGKGIDWATAEALAFGTLLVEGAPVRLSGQDSNRGTFSHRHACLIDQEDESRYTMLNHIRE
ncbi:MAG: 2-oxoglutarate dehydrogenase E1 component, partial [Kiloniellales bacterium]|nr:2-oxoglutarate dehydrogenase E1 component [Kiloniellales bacterium]